MNDELLTVDEAAAYLKVSRATIYQWVNERGMPSLKAGTLTRFRKVELDAWLERKRPASQGVAS